MYFASYRLVETENKLSASKEKCENLEEEQKKHLSEIKSLGEKVVSIEKEKNAIRKDYETCVEKLNLMMEKLKDAASELEKITFERNEASTLLDQLNEESEEKEKILARMKTKAESLTVRLDQQEVLMQGKGSIKI